jgi:hypothetical protein
MHRFLVGSLGGLALALGTLAARTPEEFPGLGEKWRHYRSPHFEVYSANDDFSSRKVLEHLELMRALLLENLQLKEKKPQPVTIFYFGSDRDFKGYLPAESRKDDSLICYWSNQPDRTVILMAPIGDDDMARTVAFSQFIEYLFRITDQNAARWYRTGVEQVYSGAHEEPGSVVVGLPSAAWVEELRYSKMFPLDQFFGTSDDSQTLQDQEKLKTFCAQSWAFIHYCRFGKDTLPKEKLEKFMRVAGDEKAQGNPALVRNACRDILGLDYPELLKQLQRYVASGDYRTVRVARPKIDEARTYSRQEPSAEEMTDRLAELTLRLDRDPRGKVALLRAIDRKIVDPRLEEVLGNDALMDGDTVAVREHWGRAVAQGTDNPAIYWQLAEIESKRWFSNFDFYFRLPDETAAGLRDLLHRSIKFAPEQAGAYEMLAWVESAARKIDVGNVNLVQEHFAQITNKARTLLALALVRLRLNDPAGTRRMLDSVGKVPRDFSTDAAATVVKGKLDAYEAEHPAAPDKTAGQPADEPPATEQK